ncbi:hypothetical protein NH340_JMT00291 [Sarcoptes scabiei]|nr:hypothetical protein NH340_JMT00291 [Sarcoptes scabiei]
MNENNEIVSLLLFDAIKMFPNRVEPKLFTSVSFLYLFWLSLNILLGQVWTDDLVRPQPQYNQDANHLNSTSNVIESLPIRDAQDKHHFIDSNHSDRVYLVKGSIPSNLIKNESIDLDRFKSGQQSETSTIQTSFHVYFIFFIGIMPACIGAMVWWLQNRLFRRSKCCCTKSSNDSSSRFNRSDSSFDRESEIEDSFRRVHNHRDEAIRPVATATKSKKFFHLNNLYRTIDRPIHHQHQHLHNHHHHHDHGRLSSYFASLTPINNGEENDPNPLRQENYHHHRQHQRCSNDSNRNRSIYSLELPRNSLEMIEILGEGNFGQVWKAKSNHRKYLNCGLIKQKHRRKKQSDNFVQNDDDNDDDWRLVAVKTIKGLPMSI